MKQPILLILFTYLVLGTSNLFAHNPFHSSSNSLTQITNSTRHYDPVKECRRVWDDILRTWHEFCDSDYTEPSCPPQCETYYTQPYDPENPSNSGNYTKHVQCDYFRWSPSLKRCEYSHSSKEQFVHG